MKVTINNMEDLTQVMKTRSIPSVIIQDINQRITDWLASGGSSDHPYITQQFKFVERYVNSNYGRGRSK